MFKIKIISFITLMLISGCSKNDNQVTQAYPIDYWPETNTYKKLYTYAGQPVIRELVVVENNKVIIKAMRVYLNNKSRLVFKDGTPIRLASGESIAWERSGVFIDTNYNIIPESTLFVLDGKPMPDNTPILIKDHFDDAKALIKDNK